MISIFIAALILVSHAAFAGVPGWSADTWPLADHSNTVNIYHQRIANDFLSNTLVRARVVLDDTWNLVNTVDGIAVTNQFGLYLDPITSTSVYVRLNRDALEFVTDKVEALTPLYSFPYYAVDSECGFDTWFAAGAPEFPVGSKADLFHKAGIGKLLVYSNEIPFLTFADYISRALDQYGQVTNSEAYWTKRKNRPNNLILGIWGPKKVAIDPDYYWGGWSNPVPALQINTYPPFYDSTDPRSSVTEYYTAAYTGETRLIDLQPYERPVFIWRPSGTNVAFPMSLQLSYSDTVGGGSSAWVTNNQLMNNVAEPGGVLQALSAPTTAANRAWVSTRLQMSGGANSDSVILKWTNTMSTYEGTKAWDNVLLPEQFDEHYVALTNLFLTPWTYWTWTDSIAATNQAAVSWTNLVTALYTIDEATLFDDYSTNATTDNMECIDEATIQGSATWWLLFSGLPWFTVDVPPLLADSVVWTSNLVAGIPPQFTYSLNFSASIVEAASGNTWFDYQESSAIPETADWYWSASREGSVTDHSLLGVSTKSRVTAINLNTTVPHRMHVYAKYDFGQFTNNTPYYHRIEIVPSSGFSTDPTLSSSYIDLTTNVAGFSATPVTSSAPLGCWASLIGDIVYTNFGETYSDITMTTQTLSWATSVVASVTTTNTYNPETLTIERDIYHKSNTLYTAEFSPTELSGRAIHWGIYYPIRMWETTNGGSGVQSCGTNYTMVEDTFSASTNTINTTATEFAANPDYTLYPDDYLENGTNVSETVRVWTVSNTNGDLAYDTVTVEYPSTLCGIDVDPPYGPGENQPDTWDQFELAFYMDYLRGYYPTAEGSNWVFGAVSCCDLGSGYNHGDMSGSATSSVSISSGFVNTVDVKVLIEWDH